MSPASSPQVEGFYLDLHLRYDSRQMITIQVFRSASGSPASGERVHVWKGDNGSNEYTNSAGEAHFASLTPSEYEVTVAGKSIFKGRIEGRQVVYV